MGYGGAPPWVYKQNEAILRSSYESQVYRLEGRIKELEAELASMKKKYEECITSSRTNYLTNSVKLEMEEALAQYLKENPDESNKIRRLSSNFQKDHSISEKEDFLEVVAWKSPRPLGYARRNDISKIKETTRTAFSLIEEGKVVSALRSLLSPNLLGVQTRVATAILTFYDPSRFSVMDINVFRSLLHLGVVDSFSSWFESPEDYMTYLDACKKISIWFGHDLRDTDRALWRMASKTQTFGRPENHRLLGNR